MAHTAEILRRMRDLSVHPDDFQERFSRSGGPGGQHVNKVSTAATVRHIPTGQSVTASDSRSQGANRLLAMNRLLDGMETQRKNDLLARRAAVSKARRQRAKRSRGTKRKLVADKRHRGETKKLRGRVGGGE